MIPEFPPNSRAELESRVTAWLLGELSADQAAQVREQIEKDPELARLRDRLSQTLNLLRETVATPIGDTPIQPAPLKISQEKRGKLLASFKTITPAEFAPSRRTKVAWPVVLALAASIALAALIAVPSYVRSRTSTQQNAIVNNLRLLDSAKQQWALEQRQLASAKPTMKDLEPYFGHGGDGEQPGSVAGETYDIGAVGQMPVAQLKNHKTVTLNGQSEQLAANNLPAPVAAPQDIEVAPGSPAPLPAATTPPEADRSVVQGLKKKNSLAYMDASKENGNPSDRRELPHDDARDSEALQSQEKWRQLPPPEKEVSIQYAAASDVSGSVDKLGAPTSTPRTRALRPALALPAQSSTSLPPSGAAGVVTAGSFALAGKAVHSEGAVAAAPIGGVAVSGRLDDGVDQSLSWKSPDDLPSRSLIDRQRIPTPEVQTASNAFTTFSLNVSDVAFRIAQASLEKGQMPDAASMRSEEFINAFDYRDPEPAPGAPIGFAWERAGDRFAHHRDFLRFAVKTAAQGRPEGQPLNLVLLLDKSGSMERADRVEIIANALRVLAKQLNKHDTLSVVVFARTARLFVDGAAGDQAGKIAKKLRNLTPEGGTNLEEAMKLAYKTALRHYLANGENRVVLLTDGAANLGNLEPETLQSEAEGNRAQGIALDCFGVGWDGYNDDLLERLSRAGGGRYGFVNTPEEAATEFAGKLAGALRVAAEDVKVQVEFNPHRVTAFRQIGYAKDQLKKEDFRDNSVRAASIGAAESGNALYTIEVNASGEGPLGTVHVRFRSPGTKDYQEHEWTLPYSGTAVALDKASPAMRLTAVAAEFCEWLAGSSYAGEVTPDRLLDDLRGVPDVYGADAKPLKLEWMIRQAKSISGK